MDSCMNERTEVIFRDAVAADVPAVVALVESAYRGDASRAGWTTEADLLDGQRIDPAGVAAVIGRSDSRVLLAEQATGSDGAATLLACCHIEKQGGDCYFGMFSVRPERQGSGVGKMVLAEAERVASIEWGCTRVRMTVIDVRDELIAWYERRGYSRTGEYRPFPYGDPRYGVPKRDDLRFEWLVKPLSAQVAA
jgi:GNAT superfamily N-acetyltransferase